MKFGLLLPGQGAQFVGMGADFQKRSSAAAEVFERADRTLNLPLSHLCFEGPLEELTKTDIAQPAIYTCSLAALAAFEEQLQAALEPVMAAGLSLGEYTALTAAKALNFEDGLRLVRLRGQAMQDASEAKPSGMSSVMGLEREPLEKLCSEVAARTGLICQVANLNSPGQIVVSGETAALDELEPKAREAGAKRAMRLNVAGAFHSEVMRPAAERLETALAAVDFQEPLCPIWQNATGQPETRPEALKTHLAAQLTAPVLWQDSFASMAQELDAANPGLSFLEPAPGKVLAGLARKIHRPAKIQALDSADALENLLAELHN